MYKTGDVYPSEEQQKRIDFYKENEALYKNNFFNSFRDIENRNFKLKKFFQGDEEKMKTLEYTSNIIGDVVDTRVSFCLSDDFEVQSEDKALADIKNKIEKNLINKKIENILQKSLIHGSTLVEFRKEDSGVSVNVYTPNNFNYELDHFGDIRRYIITSEFIKNEKEYIYMREYCKESDIWTKKDAFFTIEESAGNKKIGESVKLPELGEYFYEAVKIEYTPVFLYETDNLCQKLKKDAKKINDAEDMIFISFLKYAQPKLVAPVSMKAMAERECKKNQVCPDSIETAPTIRNEKQLSAITSDIYWVDEKDQVPQYIESDIRSISVIFDYIDRRIDSICRTSRVPKELLAREAKSANISYNTIKIQWSGLYMAVKGNQKDLKPIISQYCKASANNFNLEVSVKFKETIEQSGLDKANELSIAVLAGFLSKEKAMSAYTGMTEEEAKAEIDMINELERRIINDEPLFD